MEERPLIVTLNFDAATFERLDALRSRNFPAALNQLSAHLTLFHHLPGDQSARVFGEVKRVAGRARFPILVSHPRSLGRGVALAIEAAELHAVRATLATAFWDNLTRQDAQGFRPHVTIQNKVSANEARALLDRLALEFVPWSGVATGLSIWRYLGGPWRLESEFAFSAPAA